MKVLSHAQQRRTQQSSDGRGKTQPRPIKDASQPNPLKTRRLQQRNSTVYLWRRFIVGISVVVTLAFIGKTVLSFFNVEYVSLEVYGNKHYTKVHIYDVLAENLDNIFTESEEQTALYLKENLSYIKDAYISKHLMRRMFTIRVTEREQFALLEYRCPPSGVRASAHTDFFLIDKDGYVLESVIDEFPLRKRYWFNKRGQFPRKPLEVAPSGNSKVPEAVEKHARMPVLIAEGDVFPAPGGALQIPAVKLGLRIFSTALLREPELAKQIVTIDASEEHKVKLEISGIAAQAWIAKDAVDTGLHHIALFLKHRDNHSAPIDTTTRGGQMYLDARFEDALYWGRDN